MIRTIYIIIVAYFLLGGIAIYYISRKKSKEEARHERIKFITYFIIINGVFLSIAINPLVFRIIAGSITVVGLYELLTLFSRSGWQKKGFFPVPCRVCHPVFWIHLFQPHGKGLGTFYICHPVGLRQLQSDCGATFWKTENCQKTSPNKTLEGAAGGTLMCLLTAVIIRDLIGSGLVTVILLTAGVVIWAFLGDMAASCYKRHYNVKDYSRLIPGHGGVLDRFDSMIAAGAWMALMGTLINFTS